MENIITKKEYSFKEKFFDFKNEKRIRRYQFLARFFGIGALIGLLTYGIIFAINYVMLSGDSLEKTILSIGKSIIIWNIVWGIAWVFYIISWFYLASKRDNDIGKKVSSLIRFSTLFSIIGIIANSFVYLMIFFNINIELGALLTIFKLIINLSSILMLIITIVLIFYPGKKWDNEFWEDPINTKIGLLG